MPKARKVPAFADGRRIQITVASYLTAEDMRALIRWCDNQRESWWNGGDRPLTAAQILALYHAAHDADYAGMDEWHADQPEAALLVWRAIQGD